MNIFRIPPPLSGKIKFISGDMVFLGAGAAGVRPPFEHVAIVLGLQVASSADEIADVNVYGLPESLKRKGTWGLIASTARKWWLNNWRPDVRKVIQDRVLGDPVSGWNAGYRADLTSDHINYFETRVLMAIGHTRFTYTNDAGARIEEEVLQNPAQSPPGPSVKISTNCTGFVRWCYQEAHLKLVVDTFHKYCPPFGPPDPPRNYASPGHLARAADLSLHMFPYVPSDSGQAERDAPV